MATEHNGQTFSDPAVVLFGSIQHGEYAAHDFAVVPRDVCHESTTALHYGTVKSTVSD
ncbi:hypothetical protein AB9M62_56815 [Bacillales bacterium AN1005]